MNKFIVRLPGANQPKRSSDDTRTKHQKVTARPATQCTQLYLDLGQKNMGRTEKCPTCQMVYVNDDADDLRSHQEYCKQVRDALHKDVSVLV